MVLPQRYTVVIAYCLLWTPANASPDAGGVGQAIRFERSNDLVPHESERTPYLLSTPYSRHAAYFT